MAVPRDQGHRGDKDPIPRGEQGNLGHTADPGRPCHECPGRPGRIHHGKAGQGRRKPRENVGHDPGPGIFPHHPMDGPVHFLGHPRGDHGGGILRNKFHGEGLGRIAVAVLQGNAVFRGHRAQAGELIRRGRPLHQHGNFVPGTAVEARADLQIEHGIVEIQGRARIQFDGSVIGLGKIGLGVQFHGIARHRGGAAVHKDLVGLGRGPGGAGIEQGLHGNQPPGIQYDGIPDIDPAGLGGLGRVGQGRIGPDPSPVGGHVDCPGVEQVPLGGNPPGLGMGKGAGAGDGCPVGLHHHVTGIHHRIPLKEESRGIAVSRRAVGIHIRGPGHQAQGARILQAVAGDVEQDPVDIIQDTLVGEIKIHPAVVHQIPRGADGLKGVGLVIGTEGEGQGSGVHQVHVEIMVTDQRKKMGGGNGVGGEGDVPRIGKGEPGGIGIEIKDVQRRLPVDVIGGRVGDGVGVFIGHRHIGVGLGRPGQGAHATMAPDHTHHDHLPPPVHGGLLNVSEHPRETGIQYTSPLTKKTDPPPPRRKERGSASIFSGYPGPKEDSSRGDGPWPWGIKCIP